MAKVRNRPFICYGAAEPCQPSPPPPNFPSIPNSRLNIRNQRKYFDQIYAESHENNLRAEHARTRANRANALYSTGPRTLTGKEVSRLNAVRHGLTGRQILLPSEDADAYAKHIERYRRDFAPVSERELELTQMLADTQWRLSRIPGLESAVYAMGRIRYVDLFPDVEDGMRSQLIDYYTMEQSGKELRNLSLQEGRLRRQYASDLRELKQLQSERKEQEKAQGKTKAAVATTQTNETEKSDWVRFYNSAEPASKPGQPKPPANEQSRPQKAEG